MHRHGATLRGDESGDDSLGEGAGPPRAERKGGSASGGRPAEGRRTAGRRGMASLMPGTTKREATVPLFDPRVLLGPHRVMFIGATGSGKSSIIMRFLYEIREHIPVMVVWCGSEGETNQYGPHVPPLYIHSKLRKQNLGSYIQQRKLAKLCSSNPTCLAVFDDVFERPTDFNNRHIRALY